MSTCPKCASRLFSAPSPRHLVADYFIDTWDLQDAQSAAVKCLACGWYADAIMLANKAKQADAQRLVAQAESWALDHASTDARRTAHDSHSVGAPEGAVAHGDSWPAIF